MTYYGGDQPGQNYGDKGPDNQGQDYPSYPGPNYGPPAGQPYAYPPVAPVPGTNGMAIAALIVSLVACGPVGLILGIVSLSQIKKSGEQGRGMAIAGVVIGAISIIAVIIAIIVLAVAANQVSNDPYYYDYN